MAKPSSPAGHPRQFRVVFVLGKPGHVPVADRDVSFDLSAQGDSHISVNAACAPVPGVKGEIKTMHIDAGSAGYTIRKAYPNARGFIGRIEVTVTADNFAHADAIATRALAPFLSLCVVMLNVPVSVYQTEVTESRTQNRRVTTTLPFFESPPLPTPHGISDEFLIKIGEDFAGHVAAEGHPVFARDAATDARITSDVIRRKRVRALYGCRWREAEKS